jgi:murein DD-endopeptidase MepM/ murein hydrolase activator NlpD
MTVYAHNQMNLVEEGSWVEVGQIIGKVGQTGRATGPHLHFEIRKNNRAVDPLLFLK